MERIRQVAIQPSFDEAAYRSANREKLAEMIAKDLQDTYARRAAQVANTAKPVIDKVYMEQGSQYENIVIPIVDGKRGYNVPVDLKKCYESQCAEIYKTFSKVLMLLSIDDNWREHLREMDDLRQSVQNAAYEQKDPLLIYKFESFELFSKMLGKINREVLSTLNKGYIPVRDANTEEAMRQRQQQQERAKVDMSRLQTSRAVDAARNASTAEKSKPAPVHAQPKVGRNDPCPCGSGKKYKNCHGRGVA